MFENYAGVLLDNFQSEYGKICQMLFRQSFPLYGMCFILIILTRRCIIIDSYSNVFKVGFWMKFMVRLLLKCGISKTCTIPDRSLQINYVLLQFCAFEGHP